LSVTHAEGQHVEGADADPDQQARGVAADAGDHLAQEAGAVLKASAVAAAPGHRAQKFVAKIAVAMLEIDERVTGLLGEYRRTDEVADQIIDLTIGQAVIRRAVMPNLRSSSGW
jgi:hypothetical protein